PLIGAFLEHVEHERHNTLRTCNACLGTIHSLFRFAALDHPKHNLLIQRVLAIPPKRLDRAVVSFLTGDDLEALLASRDRSGWIGRRDDARLLVALQTGLRLSEFGEPGDRNSHAGFGRGMLERGPKRTSAASYL